MITTRTLQQRRQVAATRRHLPVRGRASQIELGRFAEQAAQRLRVGGLGRVYAGTAVVAGVALIYLLLTAQTTSASYQIQQLRTQQRQLHAERSNYVYREAEVKAPATVDREAAQTGMQRLVPVRYLTAKTVKVELNAPIGRGAPERRPIWQRWRNSVLHLGGDATAGAR